MLGWMLTMGRGTNELTDRLTDGQTNRRTERQTGVDGAVKQ